MDSKVQPLTNSLVVDVTTTADNQTPSWGTVQISFTATDVKKDLVGIKRDDPKTKETKDTIDDLTKKTLLAAFI
jgi:hypothetical protein